MQNTETTRDLRGDDVIDSRDVEERFAALEADRTAAKWPDQEANDKLQCGDIAPFWTADDGTLFCDDWNEDMEIEYQELKELREDASGHPSWEGGISLIRDDHFEAYVREYAEDTGAIERDSWISDFVDWTAAAESMQADFKQVDFGGDTYWYRS